MGVAEVTEELIERREDFPVESFRFLEGKLQELRRVVMNRAAEIASVMDSNPTEYRVTSYHIDLALSEILGDPDKALEVVNVRRPGEGT